MWFNRPYLMDRHRISRGLREGNYLMIRVTFSDFHVDEYDSESDAANMILEAHAEGVGVESIEDTENKSVIYSLIWGVKLQKEC
jgi:hypothetical protein